MWSYFIELPWHIYTESRLSQTYACVRITWGAYWNRFLGPALRDSESTELRWSPRICIFPKLSAKADAVIQHTTASSPGTEKSWNKTYLFVFYSNETQGNIILLNFLLCIFLGTIAFFFLIINVSFLTK